MDEECGTDEIVRKSSREREGRGSQGGRADTTVSVSVPLPAQHHPSSRLPRQMRLFKCSCLQPALALRRRDEKQTCIYWGLSSGSRPTLSFPMDTAKWLGLSSPSSTQSRNSSRRVRDCRAKSLTTNAAERCECLSMALGIHNGEDVECGWVPLWPAQRFL